MSSFTFVRWVQIPNQEDLSHISDMLILGSDGGTTLVASTRYDGWLTTWDISGRLQLVDTQNYRNDAVLGSSGAITEVATSRGTEILGGGGGSSALQTHFVRHDDTIAAGRNVTPTEGTDLGTMAILDSVTLSSGRQIIYGRLPTNGDLGRLLLDASGNVLRTDTLNIVPNGATVTAAANTTINGTPYLITAANGLATGVTLWSIGASGQLTRLSDLTPESELWIHEPTTIATASIGQNSFVIVGSAGSSSISVMSISAENTLEITDHLLDDLDSRFAGITALETVVHNGQTYVIAGGADDGVSIYLLMPSGQLIPRGHIADSTTMGLDNISAIVAQSNGSSIDIYVASSSEHGISHLQFENGAAGQTLTATAGGGTLSATGGSDVVQGGRGNDVVYAGAGDDIITDGAGRDTITGGAGQDTFIFGYDEQPDIIRDFQLGQDRIDLSNWPGLRSINQLVFQPHSQGIVILYGADRLTVVSADRQPIDPASFSASDLLGGLRIPTEIVPGFPDQTPETPDLPQRPIPPRPVILPSAEMFDLRPTQTATTLAGDTGRDTLTGGVGSDLIGGLEGNDILAGNSGDDILVGGEGADRLLGEGGNDVLFGGANSDRLAGGYGDDQLLGGGSADRISGGPGDDEISGGTGQDWINAGQGADVVYGGDGTDTIIGNRGNDVIYGGRHRDLIGAGGGNDIVYGGGGSDYVDGSTGHDWIEGGNGDDLLRGNTGADQIWGGDGADRIFGQTGRDRLYGGDGWDHLNGGEDHDRLYGGLGNDRLYGHTGNDRIEGGGHRDRIYGGSGADVLFGGGGRDRIWGGSGRDRIYGQSGGDRINGGLGNDVMTGGRGRDVFVFNDGLDRITDFDIRYDTLALDRDLWSQAMGPRGVAMTYGEVENGNIILDFGGGNVLRLDGLGSLSDLSGAIDFV